MRLLFLSLLVGFLACLARAHGYDELDLEERDDADLELMYAARDLVDELSMRSPEWGSDPDYLFDKRSTLARGWEVGATLVRRHSEDGEELEARWKLFYKCVVCKKRYWLQKKAAACLRSHNLPVAELQKLIKANKPLAKMKAKAKETLKEKIFGKKKKADGSIKTKSAPVAAEKKAADKSASKSEDKPDVKEPSSGSAQQKLDNLD